MHLWRVSRILAWCEFREYRVANSIFHLHEKAPRAQCLKYNEKSRATSNSMRITAMSLHNRCGTSEVCVKLRAWSDHGKGWSSHLGHMERRAYAQRAPRSSWLWKTATVFITHQKPRHHSSSIQSCESIADTLVLNATLFSLENQKGQGRGSSCLNLNLTNSMWAVSVSLKPFFPATPGLPSSTLLLLDV